MNDHLDPVAPPADVYAVIDALLDGHAVEPNAIRHALADPDVRDYFVDTLVVRQLARAAEAPGVTAPPPTMFHTKAGARARWLAAGVLLVICTAAGFAIGEERGARAAGTDDGTFVEVQAVLESAPQAPEPTRVIQLTPGINWTPATEGR